MPSARATLVPKPAPRLSLKERLRVEAEQLIDARETIKGQIKTLTSEIAPLNARLLEITAASDDALETDRFKATVVRAEYDSLDKDALLEALSGLVSPMQLAKAKQKATKHVVAQAYVKVTEKKGPTP